MKDEVCLTAGEVLDDVRHIIVVPFLQMGNLVLVRLDHLRALELQQVEHLGQLFIGQRAIDGGLASRRSVKADGHGI